jgi:hypothetical protein
VRRIKWRKSDAFYFGLESFDHPVWLCERGYGASRTAARHGSYRSGQDRLRPRFGFCLRASWAADAVPAGTVRRLQWMVSGRFPGLRAWRTRGISRQCKTRWLDRPNIPVDLAKGGCQVANTSLAEVSNGSRAAVAGGPMAQSACSQFRRYHFAT